jgi:hypothetical protein
MAYTSISPIAVGDPLKRGLGELIRTNFDDHETRMVALEANDARVNVFCYMVRNVASFSGLLGLDFYVAQQAFTMTEAKIYIFEKDSLTGFLEVDIQKSTSTNPAGFASIMTTKPSIDYSTISNYGFSTNRVFDSVEKDIAPGDVLRWDISQAPTNGVVTKFILQIYGEI